MHLRCERLEHEITLLPAKRRLGRRRDQPEDAMCTRAAKFSEPRARASIATPHHHKHSTSRHVWENEAD